MTSTADRSGFPADAKAYDCGMAQPLIDALPPDEQNPAIMLLFNLIQGHQYAQQFAAAVGLLDFVDLEEKRLLNFNGPTIANSRNLINLWRGMAARDGAMSIFHLGATLDAIGSMTKSAPSFTGKVDAAALRSARKRLRESFPGYDNLRHGVGHLAEMTSSLKKVAAHAVDGHLIFGGLEGRDFTITQDRAHRTISLTQLSVRTLGKIIHDVYSAFPNLRNLLPEVQLGKTRSSK